MAELRNLLKQVESGEVTVEKAAPRVRTLVLGQEGASATSTFMEREERAAEDKDGTNTFAEVQAAWVSGALSDEQYKALYAAVTKG